MSLPNADSAIVDLPGKPSSYGQKFELDGILTGPSGRSASVGTAWIVRSGEDFPRFVTAYPR